MGGSLAFLIFSHLLTLVAFTWALLAQPTTRVVLLGTGTPNADPERSGPAVAVVVGETAYLVDAGPGVVRRAAAAELRGIQALAVPKLSKVFVTHLHSDHTLGLPDLIFSPWTLERTTPLQVYGPRGIASMSRHLTAAYREDIKIRTRGLEPSNRTGYRVETHEIRRPGIIYQDSNVEITAFAVRHGSWPQAFGYRFKSADRTIVISGDAVPSESIVENCNGCDVLVHEVYSDSGFQKRPKEWQRYHAGSHTSARQLGELATRARPGLLILYHQLFWGTSEEELVSEVKAVYSGKVVSGKDLDVY